MLDKNIPLSRPYVIIVSGSVGSGKSTIVKELAKALGEAAVLSFDQYGEYVEWPEDMGKWAREGYDPRDIRVPKMKENLLCLLRGEEIRDPISGSTIKATKHIIIEEPSGREREEIREEVDFVVYIDTPQDVCVMRMIERVLDTSEEGHQGNFQEQSKEELAEQLEAIALWMTQYRQSREMYMHVSQRVRQGADMVVNGMDPVERITAQILEEVKRKMK